MRGCEVISSGSAQARVAEFCKNSNDFKAGSLLKRLETISFLRRPVLQGTPCN